MKSSDQTNNKNIMFYNMKIIQELFDHAMTLKDLESVNISELLTTMKTIHFVMQEVITPMFKQLSGGEEIEVEKSIFDEYDKENGYEDDDNSEINVWDGCINVANMITKAAIRVLKNSYSQCLNTNIAELIKYLKYEIQTLDQ